MFKKQLAVACCSLCLSGALSADSRFYAIGEAGYTFSEFDNVTAVTPTVSTTTNVIDDNDEAEVWGVGFGYDWADKPLRAEVIYSNAASQGYIEETIFTSSLPERTWTNIDQDTLMFNLIYDIETNLKKFEPYIGAGIGFSRTRISAFQLDNPVRAGRSASFAENSHTNVAWSLMAGTRYSISKDAYLGVGYRYLNAGSISTANNCVGTDSFICDTDETHEANLINHSLFVNLNYYF